MKISIYILFLLLFISACKPGIPKDIIQPEEMALVLNDIHIADGYISVVQPDSAKIVASSLYNGIYRKFKIDSAIYYKSMEYYYRNPVIMDEIYKNVNAGLLKQKLNLIRIDSIKNAVTAKKADIKKAADSIRKMDSLVKVMLKRREDSAKRVNSIKGLDSINKAKVKMKKKKVKISSRKKASPAKI